MEGTHTMTTPSGMYTIRGRDEAYLRRAVQKIENGTMAAPDGGTLLHMAAYSGKIEDCKKLLEGPIKYDINATDHMGETPLFRAIHQRNSEAVHFLIEKGADVTLSSAFGKTPLHHAASYGTREMVELLLSKGADLHASSMYGTPVHMAVAAGNHDTLEYLLELKADPNPFNLSLDLTPIFIATVNQSIESLDMLVKANADPNRKSYLTTPLCMAAGRRDERMVGCLLLVGADPNMLDSMGLKPIERAALDGCREIVEILFPATSPIDGYPDWSISGIMMHVRSQEKLAQFQLKKEKMYKLIKAKGEEALKKNYYDAFHYYNQAYIYNPTDAEVLSNMSLCNAMLNYGEEALKLAKMCIAQKPHWAKAHFREGVAYKVLKEYNMAAKSFKKALSYDRGNKGINKELRAVKTEMLNLKLDNDGMF